MKNVDHKIEKSGAGWLCSCGVWGFGPETKAIHLEWAKTTPTEKACDAAWEKARY
jgi:hypothetical protein